jgi:hypothetical protein
LRRALADIAEAGDAGNLAGEHDVGGAADGVDQALLAAVEIVELRLGDAVVDVDRREGKLALLGEVVEAVDAGGSLLGDALDVGDGLGEVARPLGEEALQRRREDLLFLVGWGEQFLSGLDARAPQREHGGVAAVVEDQVAGPVLPPIEDAGGIIPIFLERLALDREDGHAGLGDGGGGMVLGREDVARGPADLGAERGQRLDQHRGLDRHVQRAGDARALERLGRAEFLAQRHQARHLGLGDLDFLAAIAREADIGDDIVFMLGLGLGRHVRSPESEKTAGKKGGRALVH